MNTTSSGGISTAVRIRTTTGILTTIAMITDMIMTTPDIVTNIHPLRSASRKRRRKTQTSTRTNIPMTGTPIATTITIMARTGIPMRTVTMASSTRPR